MLLRRRPVSPAEAIRRLTPLQGQHPPAPYVALAARLEGFDRGRLERAIARRHVVKTTIMRRTLHLAAASDYPAYARIARKAGMRTWRKHWAALDEERVTAELRAWFDAEPRSNTDIRERVAAYGIEVEGPWTAVWFARVLLPLVQLPPAGFHDDPRRPRFVVDPRPLPDPADAAALVLRRYLAAFGPASRRDAGAWAGVAQADLAAGWECLETVVFGDEHGRELHDLPRLPLPGASTLLPPRFLAHWDQSLLAYEQRDRIIPPELLPLRLTISGDPTVTIDGRVAATWSHERAGDVVRLTVRPLVELRFADLVEEAERTARVLEPDARKVEVAEAA